jgi:hypothetical protein
MTHNCKCCGAPICADACEYCLQDTGKTFVTFERLVTLSQDYAAFFRHVHGAAEARLYYRGREVVCYA